MSKKEQVWVVDDDSAIRWVLERTLTSDSIECRTFESADQAIAALDNAVPDALISDIKMPGTDGLSLLQYTQQHFPQLPVIIITAHSDLDAAVNAYQKGAFEYLPKPFDIDEAMTLVERALSHAREQNRKSVPQDKPQNDPEIIGESPAMQEVFRAIGRLSRSSISVLINGESGTGKELVAHALHRHSPRSSAPFIALNMAAIPHDLIESELFGHEKGAFTGANSVRHGRFEQANNGTLFLDEIGDMPLDIQTRLLRVLSDGQFYRVGGHSPIKVDVRIVAATHQNLDKRVANGKFREDLYHRLNVIKIQIPSLRERPDDIPMLANRFLTLAAEELAVEKKTLHPETIKLLMQLPWSGNVRQLENSCRWLTVMAAGQEVLPSDLSDELLPDSKDTSTKPLSSWQIALQQEITGSLNSGKEQLLDTLQPEFETILIKAALEHTQGKKQLAAQLLGWGRNTLTRKIKELNL
ncbi:nitrogen regulation protein NR(I) [Vibrio sp. SS-MA-C1-2]|uniref:nitrogen regulation protein NR(I) n=1 Tax=Vibrio sp. SS-MA-C1-2 TaxID=2908646 RepID=UPI001F1C0F2D|nr:nitrogen regulation protein NR(I) [Vibrio sp. SS-MA-C1-2]UJF19431.1 nitrogen regulation protein NR(I) [Vibrio sp. SS-MA-C1-2]